ncbi:hypothetical protein HYS31_01285 [Candidatus Woesearchaeota archaeon]|nr:hypothetical protein [Candidatus Woesearchaeota archaeon]
MAEGWLTRWWSKFIKVPFFLRAQMRRRDRKAVRLLHHLKFFIYDKIPKEVLKEHRVTKAMKDQLKVNKEAKELEKAEFDLGFDEEVEETLTLNEIKEIEAMLLQHEEQHGVTGYEEEFGKKVVAILSGVEAEDRKTYFTYLEPIIKVAEKKGDHEALMEKIRLLGSTQTNLFAALAMRLDIRHASKGITKLRHDKKAIRNALKEWDNAKGNRQKAEAHLKNALAQVEADIQSTLHSDALVAKRDFLLIILTLKYLDDAEGKMQEYYIKQVMPTLPEEERIENLEELKRKLAEDMHVLSQGMRRIFTLEHETEKLAKEIEVLAHTRRR